MPQSGDSGTACSGSRSEGPEIGSRTAGFTFILAASVAVAMLTHAWARAWHWPSGALFGSLLLLSIAAFAIGWLLGHRHDGATEEPATLSARTLDDRLALEVERARKSKMPLSIVLVDVCQTRGPSATLDADERQRGFRDTAALVVRRTLRARDTLGRTRTSELALVLPRTRLAEARHVAERLRTEIRRACRGTGFSSFDVAIGVCDLASVEDPSASQLLVGAERALRSARRGGRSRTASFDASMRCATVIVLDERRRRNRKGAEQPRK